MTRPLLASAVGLVLLAGCSRGKSGSYQCGFAAVAGQSMLIDQFTKPGTVLSSVPERVPEVLPVRIALGPAFRSVIGRADSTLIVGVEGDLPPTPVIGFGVLIVGAEEKVEGVILYEGSPIQGAPKLGTVNAGALNVPLLGLHVDLAGFQKPACPIFPDSLRR